MPTPDVDITKNVVHRIVLDIGDRRAIERQIARNKAAIKELRRFGVDAAPEVARRVRTRAISPMLRKLRWYPPRNLGMKMRWKSEKQRRYVMAMLRATNNIPYKRTGGLARAWKGEVRVGQKGQITMTVENTAETEHYWRRDGKYRMAQFVTGYIGVGTSASSMQRYLAPMQPFHKDRGWKPSAPIVAEAYDNAKKYANEYYQKKLIRIARKNAKGY